MASVTSRQEELQSDDWWTLKWMRWLGQSTSGDMSWTWNSTWGHHKQSVTPVGYQSTTPPTCRLDPRKIQEQNKNYPTLLQWVMTRSPVFHPGFTGQSSNELQTSGDASLHKPMVDPFTRYSSPQKCRQVLWKVVWFYALITPASSRRVVVAIICRWRATLWWEVCSLSLHTHHESQVEKMISPVEC